MIQTVASCSYWLVPSLFMELDHMSLCRRRSPSPSTRIRCWDGERHWLWGTKHQASISSLPCVRVMAAGDDRYAGCDRVPGRLLQGFFRSSADLESRDISQANEVTLSFNTKGPASGTAFVKLSVANGLYSGMPLRWPMSVAWHDYTTSVGKMFSRTTPGRARGLP
ncbi:hypothetical protein LY76DRAFT_218426 [Colletotrichum caudatum]|nr:hypothetical protein LY76DRAFT_218426 [Colletotrichum caudatum]